jgi:hypothetical protein
LLGIHLIFFVSMRYMSYSEKSLMQLRRCVIHLWCSRDGSKTHMAGWTLRSVQVLWPSAVAVACFAVPLAAGSLLCYSACCRSSAPLFRLPPVACSVEALDLAPFPAACRCVRMRPRVHLSRKFCLQGATCEQTYNTYGAVGNSRASIAVILWFLQQIVLGAIASL